MPDPDQQTRPNPTRLENAVITPPERPNRLTDDPEFALDLLTSEKNSLRQNSNQPPRASAQPIDHRLGRWGSVIIAVWTGALATAALVQQIRRKRRHSST